MPYTEVMPKFGRGELHSGSKHGPKVKNRKQAIAIMLSEKRKGTTDAEKVACDDPWKRFGKLCSTTGKDAKPAQDAEIGPVKSIKRGNTTVTYHAPPSHINATRPPKAPKIVAPALPAAGVAQPRLPALPAGGGGAPRLGAMRAPRIPNSIRALTGMKRAGQDKPPLPLAPKKRKRSVWDALRPRRPPVT